jgi:hypothetical protein
VVDLAAPPPLDAERLVAARARLVSFSPRQRQAYADRAADLVDELSGTASESLRGAVLEAALAVASRAEVIVLVGLDELDADHQPAAGALAEGLASRGLAVLLLDAAAASASEDTGPELVETGAGATHE